MKKLTVMFMAALLFVTFASQASAFATVEQASFSSPAAQMNYKAYGDLKEANSIRTMAAAVQQKQGPEVAYRSSGCSRGCSSGCSRGCSSGCSVGCSSGCSVGCSIGCR